MKKYLGILFLLLVLQFSASNIQAQCPMCKAAVVSNTEDGAKGVAMAGGLNTGILILFFLPYACIGTVVFATIYFVRRRRKEEARLLSETTVEDIIGNHRPNIDPTAI